MKYTLLIIIVAFLAGCSPKTGTTSSEENGSVNTKEIGFITPNLTDALTASQASNKPVFVDVSTSWCGYCKKMKKNVYTDSEVAKHYNTQFINVSFDGEKGDGINVVKKYGINGFPTHLILDQEGNVLKKHVGYLDSEELLKFGKI